MDFRILINSIRGIRELLNEALGFLSLGASAFQFKNLHQRIYKTLI